MPHKRKKTSANRSTKQGRRDIVWNAIKAGDRDRALRLADELPRSYREGVELRNFVSGNLDHRR